MGAGLIAILGFVWHYHFKIDYTTAAIVTIAVVFGNQVINRIIALILAFYITLRPHLEKVFIKYLLIVQIIGLILLSYSLYVLNYWALGLGYVLTSGPFRLSMQLMSAKIAKDNEYSYDYGALYFWHLLAMLIGVVLYYYLHVIHIAYSMIGILVLFFLLFYGTLIVKSRINQSDTI